MKQSANLSFSIDENRVEYHYIPQNHSLSSSLLDSLNICLPINQKSLSSSFLPMPQLQLSTNSSLSLCQLMLRSSGSRERAGEGSMRDEVKLESNTKVEGETLGFVELGLEYLVTNRKFSTKNVLRNFGNAQNQYILHNRRVQEQLDEMLRDKKQFQAWLRKLKLLNFEDYKKAWTPLQTDSKKQKTYKKIYRNFCWFFYKQECIPYIFNSRLTPENKKSHLLQVHKLLNGILNPQKFEGFKQ